MPSLTVEAANLQDEGPIVEVALGLTPGARNAVVDAGGTVPGPVEARAMVDTGATCSVVQVHLLAPLGLHPVGTTTISTPSSADVPCVLYAVQLVIANRFILETTVIEAPLQGQSIEALIGRDVSSTAS